MLNLPLRKHWPHDEICLWGFIPSKQWQEAYNSLQDRINVFLIKGQPAPDYLLNGSHNLLNSLQEVKA